MATLKEIRKAHRVLKTLDEKLIFLKEHYENEGYKFNYTNRANRGNEREFSMSKNDSILTGDSYDGRFSIGYSGHKYVTINGIMKKIADEYSRQKNEEGRRVSLDDLKMKFLQALNHCGLSKTFTLDEIYGYSAPIAKTVAIGDGETNLTISVSQTGEPQFATRSTLPKAFLAAAEFIPGFKETWEMAQL